MDTKKRKRVAQAATLKTKTTSRSKSSSTACMMASIQLVSMNVAGCQPSAAAPKNWTLENVTQAVRTEILKTNPDVVALQECPYATWAAETFEASGYSVLGPAKESHSGFVALLFRTAMLEQAQGVTIRRVNLPFAVPAVMVRVIQEPPSRNGGDQNENNNTVIDVDKQPQTICVASCHLAPFQEGTADRQRQVQAMIQASMGMPVIIAGDLNMRVSEDKIMEGSKLGLKDAWKMAGAHVSEKYTWNTRDNRRGKGGGFNCFYGADTRQYVTRYDRIYVHTGTSKRKPDEDDLFDDDKDGSVLKLSVPSFRLIANQPIAPSTTYFLSDHFGIAAKLKLDWKK